MKKKLRWLLIINIFFVGWVGCRVGDLLWASVSLPDTYGDEIYKEETASTDEKSLSEKEDVLAVETANKTTVDAHKIGDVLIEEQSSNFFEPELTEDITQPEKQVEINREKLKDFDYLMQNFYVVDSSTTITGDLLNVEELQNASLTLDKQTEGPQILIYHTHSQEGYSDSVEGDAGTTVVGVGEVLANLLTTQYGFQVMHHTGQYDVGDRDHAYSNAAPALEKILTDNPSIQLVIDLHRDSVNEDKHLVTEINGKPTAKIMFFNGLCRTTSLGELTNLPNQNLKQNLACSFQMQMAASEYYPDFARKIYLKGYRYNMHFCPNSLLIEVGAQNNTFAEAVNAMEPLAAVIAKVFS